MNYVPTDPVRIAVPLMNLLLFSTSLILHISYTSSILQIVSKTYSALFNHIVYTQNVPSSKFTNYILIIGPLGLDGGTAIRKDTLLGNST